MANLETCTVYHVALSLTNSKQNGLNYEFCRRSGRRYELVSVLSPTKYLQCAGLVPSRGWTGEPASDIPASLFPKHVQVWPMSTTMGLIITDILQGLHASGNMAFVKEFEAFQQHNNDYSGSGQNLQSFPDVVGGGDN